MTLPPTMIDIPEEDSADLTDLEVYGAIGVVTPEDMAEYLGHLTCKTCEGKVTITKHQLRRRAPNHYARVLFVCKDGHQGSVTFRARFLGGAS